MFKLGLKEILENLAYEAMRGLLSDIQRSIYFGGVMGPDPAPYRYAVIKKQWYFSEIAARFYTVEGAIEFCMRNKENNPNREYSLRIIEINQE